MHANMVLGGRILQKTLRNEDTKHLIVKNSHRKTQHVTNPSSE